MTDETVTTVHSGRQYFTHRYSIMFIVMVRERVYVWQSFMDFAQSTSPSQNCAKTRF